nr:prolyl-tRNA synthetase [Salmonella sp. NCTC 7297]
MNMHKSFRVQALAEKLYSELRAQGIGSADGRP